MATFEEFVPLVRESQELLMKVPRGSEQNAYGMERMNLVMITIGQPDSPETLDERISGLKDLIQRMRSALGECLGE